MNTINNDTMGILMSFMKIEDLETMKKVSTDFEKCIEHNNRKYTEMQLRELYGEQILNMFDYSEIKDCINYEKHGMIMLIKMIELINERNIKYTANNFITIYDYMYKQYHKQSRIDKLTFIKFKEEMMDNKENKTRDQILYYNGLSSITKYHYEFAPQVYL